jgi:sec-independent protein translocase protein TatA
MGSGLVSPGHLIILLLIALIVFGPKRLPELGRSLGGGMRGFKDAITGEDKDDDPEPTPTTEAPPAAAPVPAQVAAAPPSDRDPSPS